MNVFERMREAWTVFRGRDRPGNLAGTQTWYTGPSSSEQVSRRRLTPGNERSIANAVYNRIALDVARVEVHHARVDDNDFYQEPIKDSLEELFTVEANLDQNSMAYTIDLVMSLFDEGTVAEVPIEQEWVEYERPAPEDLLGDNMAQSDLARASLRNRNFEVLPKEFSYLIPGGLDTPKPGKKREIYQIRTGKIVTWKPQTVIVEIYDERTGKKEQVEVGKREICIHDNPFYSVMNERNSVYQRLVRKMNVLDVVDNNLGSDKLNMVLQLPYIVRTDVKKAEANARIKDLENQLKNSPHGLAYVDGTEKIIQLNRPVENNLQAQIEWLTKLFFSQLGITEEILNGTADENTMSNYMNRCVGVVLEAICAERKRKLLTKDQRDDGESIVYVQDPLQLIPATSLSDIFDKLSRNAILSPNECRGTLGYKPSKDPSANQLVNRNMPVSETPGAETDDNTPPEEDTKQKPIPVKRE